MAFKATTSTCGDHCTEITVPNVQKVCIDFKQLNLSEECNYVAELDPEFNSEQVYFRAQQLLLELDSAPPLFQDKEEKAMGVTDIKDLLVSASVEKVSMEEVFILLASANKDNDEHKKEVYFQLIKSNLSKRTFFETLRLCFLFPELHVIDLVADFFCKNSDLIFSDEFDALFYGDTVKCYAFLMKTKRPKYWNITEI